MKRILLCLLCAALLTGCGKEADPAVAAAQRYQSVVQAVGDGTSVGVDLTDAQIAQAVADVLTFAISLPLVASFLKKLPVDEGMPAVRLEESDVSA